jgi:hypothetical protein
MLNTLLTQIQTQPETVEFNTVISAINASYDFTPTRFVNGLGEGSVINEAGTNEGSCRIFAFAQLHQLTQAQTLHCFGDYYRKDVLDNTSGDDHANIRTFMRDGWAGIQFDHVSLTAKV